MPKIVGQYTYGNKELSVKKHSGAGELIIGNYCSIAEKVTIFLGSEHRTDWITTFPFGHRNTDVFGGAEIKGHPTTKGDVVIGNDVWIGYNVTIMSGVKIGDGAVIAANSHVVKDVLPYSITGGNPAKFIKYRFDNEIVELLLKLRWWDLNDQQVKEVIHTLCAPPTVEILAMLNERYKR